MKTYLECIPCFFRQALDAAKISKVNVKKQKEILNRVADAVKTFSLDLNPPQMGQIIHSIVRTVSKNKDPYLKIKNTSHDFANKIHKELKNKINKANDKFLMAVILAITGNIIDFGVKNNINIKEELEKILNNKMPDINKENNELFQYKKLKNSLSKTENLLYLGDNVGETIFDATLLEQIKKDYPNINIYYAVRGAPAINDALEIDAYKAKIDKYATIINNGYDAPGTILNKCSPKFKNIYKKVDMIISKGQGNYESLSDRKENIFFLFMAKCSVIAKHIGRPIGSIVLIK